MLLQKMIYCYSIAYIIEPFLTAFITYAIEFDLSTKLLRKQNLIPVHNIKLCKEE